MERRTFMSMIGAAGLPAGDAGAATVTSQGYVLLQRYWMKNGTQAARVHDYLAKGLLPRRAALGQAPLVLEALVAAHMPQVAVLTPYDSLAAIAEAEAKLAADEKWRTALATWEENAEQPYESVSTSVLALTPYSPKLQPSTGEAPKTPRLFELRVYHSPTQRQLAALHERFAGPEIKIFHRSGINPILYSSTVFGDDMPNLTYVIPFATLADREKAWATFGADPEWTKVRAESIAKHGQISSVMNMSLYRATPYSPVQ